jgi:hypothetical protein
MIKRIEEETKEFPSDFYNGYWHLHLPVAQSFIDSEKTPFGIKRLCVQTLLKAAKHLIGIKPHTDEKYRVVVSIDFSKLFNAQIIVFHGDTHFKGFFDRNNEFQKWIPLNEESDFGSEWKLNIPQNVIVRGIREEIADEDGEYKRNIWFVGELE